jgi:hypothetical protein
MLFQRFNNNREIEDLVRWESSIELHLMKDRLGEPRGYFS